MLSGSNIARTLQVLAPTALSSLFSKKLKVLGPDEDMPLPVPNFVKLGQLVPMLLVQILEGPTHKDRKLHDVSVTDYNELSGNGTNFRIAGTELLFVRSWLRVFGQSHYVA
jgi:hypothetical protein